LFKKRQVKISPPHQARQERLAVKKQSCMQKSGLFAQCEHSISIIVMDKRFPGALLRLYPALLKNIDA
jgi:hypothetical protein